MGMKTQKLTPKQKKEVAARVDAGERQTDLVKEYGVSPALISRIVKQSRAGKQKSDVPVSRSPVDLSDKTADQLCNRYRQIHRELGGHNDELQQRLKEVDGLEQSIENESSKPDGVRDESWILAQKKRLTWCQDTSQTAYEMARLYQEASAILQVFAKKGISIPVGPSIRMGLLPASQAK